MTYDESRLTPRMARCLEQADEFARGFGHDYIGTEHVVLSILADKWSAPAGILDRMGALGYFLYELKEFLETGESRPNPTRLVPVPPTEVSEEPPVPES